MEPFDIIDTSGDAGIRSYGQTLEEAFANAALGMYTLITDIEDINEDREITVETESHSIDSLLVSWLNELVFHFDAYGFIGKGIKIHSLQDNRISATVSGEAFDREKHSHGLLIKAATYHKLKIERINGKWEAAVIFDI